MAYRPDLLVPYGYGTTYRTLGWLRTWLLAHHHPEYVERLVAWLDSKDGTIGVGGGWRSDGSQPDKPGFAPEGKSFHQNQRYSDGFIGAAAVDLVAPDGPDANFSHDGVRWANVPAQGSADAARWGVHCNIGTEAWHMQPVEIDGWQSWVNAGSPCPKANYPFPNRFPPARQPKPEPVPSLKSGLLDMVPIAHEAGASTFWYTTDTEHRHNVRSLKHIRTLINAGAVDAVTGARLNGDNWVGATVLSVADLNDYLGTTA